MKKILMVLLTVSVVFAIGWLIYIAFAIGLDTPVPMHLKWPLMISWGTAIFCSFLLALPIEKK